MRMPVAIRLCLALAVGLPRKAVEVYDVFNRKVVARDVSEFSFDASLHSSWLFAFP